MIYVFDDVDGRAREWAESIKAASLRDDVEVLSQCAFSEAVDQLVERQRTFIGKPCAGRWGECVFDKADLLVVDYELLQLEGKSTLTGANVAFLARIFSAARAVATLNRFHRLYGSKPVFDLDLVGHAFSGAAVELQGNDLGNPALWSGRRATSRYRPSYWPRIDVLIEQVPLRAEEAISALDDPIFEFLGFPDVAHTLIPRSVLQQLTDNDPSTVTLRDFAFQCVRRESAAVHLNQRS